MSGKIINVLVVEDEPMLLMMAGDVVRDAGFNPIFAKDADEAISILQDRLDIRIVFTDVDMPGSMNGIKLAEAIRGRWPPIKIIVVSGHVDVKQSDLPSDSQFFKKPYDDRRVIEALQKIAA